MTEHVHKDTFETYKEGMQGELQRIRHRLGRVEDRLGGIPWIIAGVLANILISIFFGAS